jgi:hypothetical protein
MVGDVLGGIDLDFESAIRRFLHHDVNTKALNACLQSTQAFKVPEM